MTGDLDVRRSFPTNAIQFRLSIKVLFKLPLRQTAGMVASLLKLAGPDWPVPDFSTLCRRQKTLAVQVPYRRTDGPLNLLVDSTGIKFLGDGAWGLRRSGLETIPAWPGNAPLAPFRFGRAVSVTPLTRKHGVQGRR